MIAIYASTALILLASLLLGRAILDLIRWPAPAWLSGAAGFAALVVLAPLLVRLPGRATTAAILIGLLLVAAGAQVARSSRGRTGRRLWPVAVAVAAIALAMASLPFLFNERVGVLGEGIYTNDHAAQLFWAEWLAHGFGPEPSAVGFGYPVGPQAVAVIAAQVTASSLVSSFNGLLLAIPVLAGLAALAALGGMPVGRRIAIGAICGLPYLAASFLAQSAFKETAMGLFVLAFAVALSGLSGRIPGHEQAPPKPAVAVLALLLAAASVFTFSLPGLVWFALAIPIWLALEAVAGRSPVDWGRLRHVLAAHRAAAVIGALVLVAIAGAALGPATGFIEKIDDVQASAGRLASPVFPGEALGVWPEGDFRIVRGEVPWALLAAGLGALALGYGVLALVRARQFALLAMLIAGALVYLAARLFAEIHVEAKALVVIAHVVLLVSLRSLLAPESAAGGSRSAHAPGRTRIYLRYGLGVIVLVGAATSTLLALRAAPVGFDHRAAGLERLAARIQGKSVAFLGVDRFAGYRLRGTLARAPAGYVPEEIEARPEKIWQQGQAADFDTLDSGKLDKFDYAITTAAAYQSTPPENFTRVAAEGDYVLWERRGPTTRSRVLAEGGAPGVELDCAGDDAPPANRSGAATVLGRPFVSDRAAGNAEPRVETAAGGQEAAFTAPGGATVRLRLGAAGRYALSLQYHSQVSLEVLRQGRTLAELPPSLDGMYIDGAGGGGFWPAGELTALSSQPERIEIRAVEPTGLQRALGVERRVWLGELAATPLTGPGLVALGKACGSYVDHFTLERRGARR